VNTPRGACGQRIQEIQAALGNRGLLWFGVRGADAAPLAALPQFRGAFSIIAPLGTGFAHDECLETLSGERVDLDTYDIDADRSAHLETLRRSLYDALRDPTGLVVYRPSRFLSSVYFPRMEQTLNLGMFHERQAPFEHKPWVETELRAIGVPTLPWRYYPDHDRGALRAAVEKGPLVIRASRSDGGAGIVLVDTPEDIEQIAPRHDDSFLAACPYLPDATPLNVNACVFPNGEAALHAASIQIIGHPDLTTRRFGYCGNDFAAVRNLPHSTVVALEGHVRTLAKWLSDQGFRGAFGVDALLDEAGGLYIVEINPRFQGSSWAAADIDRSLDRPDMYLNHVAAFLGLPAPADVPLTALIGQQPLLSLIVYHNCSGCPQSSPSLLTTGPLLHTMDLLPMPGTRVASDAALARALVSSSVVAEPSIPRKIAPALCPTPKALRRATLYNQRAVVAATPIC
jgi:hypothetical protein